MTNYLLKFVLAGNSGVGKSCFMSQYISETFLEEHEQTVGVEFESKEIDIDEQTCLKIQVWDTAGELQFRAIARQFFKCSAAAIFIYDVTSRESFQSIEKWYQECKLLSNDLVQCAIVGTKIDLVQMRQVSQEEGEKLSQELNCKFYEVDCHSKETIIEIFNVLSMNVLMLIEIGMINPEKDIYGVKMDELEQPRQQISQIQKQIIQPSNSSKKFYLIAIPVLIAFILYVALW